MKNYHKKGKFTALFFALVLSCSLFAAPVQATGEMPPAGEQIGDTVQQDPLASPASSEPQISQQPSGGSSSQTNVGNNVGQVGGDGVIITPPSESSVPEWSEPSVPEEGGESQPVEEPGNGESGWEEYPGEGSEGENSGEEWNGEGESSIPEEGDGSNSGETTSSDPEYYEPVPPSYSGTVVDSAPNMITSVPQEDSDPTQFTNQDLEDIRNLASGQEQEQTTHFGKEEEIPKGGGIFESDEPSQSAGDSTLLVVGVVLIVLGGAGIAFAIIRMLSGKGMAVAQVPQTAGGPRDLYSDSHMKQIRENPSTQSFKEQEKPSQATQDRGYYDDPNNDPYSDYYDDIDGYAGTSSQTQSQIPPKRSSGQASSSAQKNVDAKEGDDFDWDDFFQNGGNLK